MDFGGGAYWRPNVRPGAKVASEQKQVCEGRPGMNAGIFYPCVICNTGYAAPPEQYAMGWVRTPPDLGLGSSRKMLL